VLAGVVLSTALVAACSTGPRAGDDSANSAAATSTAAATPTRVAPLKIVTPTPFDPNVTPSPGPASTPTPAENPATYVVQEGDTLYAIALRFDVELDDLIALNGLSDPNDIQTGQELQIPPRE
jgi:LysM repeat protein